MQLIRDLPSTSTPAPTPCAITLGNFDGVHMGHQAMLARVVREAKEKGLAPAALSFWPSPQEYFGRPQPRIYSVRQNIAALRAAGIERLYLLRFNEALAKMDAQDFVANVLLAGCGAKTVLTGEDFRFGRNRAGDIWTLRALMGDQAQVMPEVKGEGERVSSSRIRHALAQGHLPLANALLGRAYAIEGHVAHGDKLGRTLGFPTANIALRRASAVSGVFAVTVEGIADRAWPGVASIGVRPTVKTGARPLAEVFLFGYAGSLYGKRVAMVLKEKLREEVKYHSVEAMTAQIELDVVKAKQVLGVAL
jgi:riboflavin kinase / FMN adenylyltransferase